MSRHKADTHTLCPNCGHVTSYNYCAQCGQETHLHKDTFWGLIMHFAGHYFHYDSKFWKTMKALWFSPGRLTKEYWEGKRARSIPPVSLYIFISAVYFIAWFSISNNKRADVKHSKGTASAAPRNTVYKLDSIDKEEADGGGLNLVVSPSKGDTAGNAFERFMTRKTNKITSSPEAKRELAERFWHNFPKLFFLMIPLLAGFMKLLFLRRKEAYFVNHAIFSLHIHSFVFSLLLLTVLNPFHAIANLLTLVCGLICIVYCVVAMRRVYSIGYARSILNTFFISIGYGLCFLILFILTGLFLLMSS